MTLAIILTAAILINFALYKLYRRDLTSELEATKQRLELTETVNRNLNDYCDNLEVNNTLLVAENRNQQLRIAELERRCGRLRRGNRHRLSPGVYFEDYHYSLN
jgi:hypothetical protein